MAAYRTIELIASTIESTKRAVANPDTLPVNAVITALDDVRTNLGILSEVVNAAATVWETHGHTSWCKIHTDATVPCNCGIDKLTDAIHRARGGFKTSRGPAPAE